MKSLNILRKPACEDSTRTRPAEPPRRNHVFEKKEFVAMKMDVQRRANSTIIRPLTLRDRGTEKIVKTRRRRVDRVLFSGFGDLTPRSQICHDCYQKEGQLRLPRLSGPLVKHQLTVQ